LCVDDSPDTTAPIVKATSVMDGGCVAENQDSVDVEFYTNEPANCRWSFDDQSYENMQNQMTCSNQIYQINANQLYTCKTTLTGIKREGTTYYIRCEDQPWLEELDRSSERNANTQSVECKLSKPESKIVIDGIAPNEDFRTSTEFTTIEIQVKTFGGGDFHTCSYSMSGYEKMIEMFETGSKTHKQLLNIPSGHNTIYVECKDETGDTARNSTSFELLFDDSSPQIIRVWQDNKKVYFITSETAQCSYSNKNCAFFWNNETETQLGESHSINVMKGQVYYIRCRDEFGNLPSGCSISFIPV